MNNYQINRPEGQGLWAFWMLIGLEYPVIVTFENKCVFFDTRISVQNLQRGRLNIWAMTAKGNIETIHQTRSKQRTGILFSFILLIIQPTMFLVNFSGYIEENRSIRRCCARRCCQICT